MLNELRELRLGFVHGLASRYQRIDRALVTKSLFDLYKEIHNLAGAAGAYQFEELGQQALQLDALLRVQLNKVDSETVDWVPITQEVQVVLTLTQQAIKGQ
ncbi:Hpt domain-containing protein [Marinospirillum celere]|uniref:Hpt domain-containing protein n=1 Tax=Marinospirillum celere TaxID=1122252 RepID=UPI0015A66055|nr:Hpt domain-containing protein [Marinospirillum celere]